MPRYDIRCTAGHHADVLRPYARRLDGCPTCGAAVELEWRSTARIVTDDIPGGQWFENGFETPRKFYSHSAHRAALAAEGHQIAAKWVPGDRHLTRWDVPSAYTLESARVLLSRGRPMLPSDDTLAPITVREVPGPVPAGVQHG